VSGGRKNPKLQESADGNKAGSLPCFPYQRAGRTDSILELEEEIDVPAGYLPPQLRDVEIESWIRNHEGVK